MSQALAWLKNYLKNNNKIGFILYKILVIIVEPIVSCKLVKGNTETNASIIKIIIKDFNIPYNKPPI